MLAGTADVERLAERAPRMAGLRPEPLAVEGASVLQVAHEFRAEDPTALLPPALHPTSPPALTWTVLSCPATPVGPFTLALTRILCRSGFRTRGFLVSAVVDTAAAAALLAAQWGIGARLGRVALTRRAHGTFATVAVDGDVVLDIALLDPAPLSGADIHYSPTMCLAHTPRGLRLVQVEPRYTIHLAERGRPRLGTFDAAAWGELALRPSSPISACVTVSDVDFGRIRFVCRPGALAFDGTEPVGDDGE